MKICDGRWFFGKCSKCGARTMVRKFKSVQICVEDAKQMILNHTGSAEQVYGGPSDISSSNEAEKQEQHAA